MALGEAMSRFEREVGGRFPDLFAQLAPGLDDDEVHELQRALAPHLLPAQVEQFYRWRDGGEPALFGGWSMHSSEHLLQSYRAGAEMRQPASWLPVFGHQILSVVTLDLPDRPASDPSVWFGHTHDTYLHRLFDSLETVLDVVSDAAEAGVLVAQHRWVGWGKDVAPLESPLWQGLRTARCPAAHRRPDPPAGTSLDRFPSRAWPDEWLVPLGLDHASLTPRGATTTIADLVASASSSPVTGTVRGTVVTGAGGGRWWQPVITDGTGHLVVLCLTEEVPLIVAAGEEGEFDVVLESPHPPDVSPGSDPAAAPVHDRLHPPHPTARATAARHVKP